MTTVRICYGDEFTTECGYFYVAVSGDPVESPLFTSEERARNAALDVGCKIDESYSLFGHRREVA